MIEKLKAAGVKTSDIFVYDRYRGEFMEAGYHKILPAGIRWGGLDPEGNQFTARFPCRSATIRSRASTTTRSSGWIWFLTATIPRTTAMYRSHLGKLVTKTLNKIVAIPVLKDHGSAGVTGALKNMSHGTVNNVDRSHSTPFTNVCNQFIPQMVIHPIIRQKFVLQIMDGIRGVYHGGPFACESGKWTWEYNAIFFATDPVALDHVEWDIVDAKRKRREPPSGRRAAGKAALDPLEEPRASTSASRNTSPWPARWAWVSSTTNRPRAGGFSIQHRVVNVLRLGTSSDCEGSTRLTRCTVQLYWLGPEAAGRRNRRPRPAERAPCRFEVLDHPQQVAVGCQDQSSFSLECLLVDLEGAGEVVKLASLADGLGVGVDDLGVDACP